MRPRHALALLLALCATVAFTAPLRSPASTVARLTTLTEARLREFQSTNGFPGATMAVVLPNGREFTVAAGQSNLETKTAMRPTDRMLAGSIGKTFFATAFMRMISAGQMQLDDKIAIWLKDEPWFGRLP